MSVDPPIPIRPRLADHGSLRRSVIDGRERLFLYDGANNELLEIGPWAYRVLLCADGTRDFGGVLLAAVREGLYRRASEIHALLVELMGRGLLTDGIELGHPPRASHPERPLRPLEGYTLVCDSNGTCCSSHGAILFVKDEARRARALVPEVLADDVGRERGFVPLQSSVPGHHLSVTMVDGRCAYLDDDGRCRIQLVAGAEAKPKGCQIFPATFVDDGEAIRVSVLPECPCVFESVGRDDGATLVPPGATSEADLLPGSNIIRLPELIRVTEGSTATLAELRAWADALEPLLITLDDPLAASWALAEALQAGGLAVDAAVSALERASPPPALGLGLKLMQLDSRVQALKGSLSEAGAAQTPAGRLVDWVAEGARALLDPLELGEALAAPRRLDQERFALLAALFGLHVALEGDSIEAALREQSLRLLLARQLDRAVPRACAEHPAVSSPIVAVEVVMRGQGAGRSTAS